MAIGVIVMKSPEFESWRTRKEAFVSNHSGSTPMEVIMTVLASTLVPAFLERLSLRLDSKINSISGLLVIIPSVVMIPIDGFSGAFASMCSLGLVLLLPVATNPYPKRNNTSSKSMLPFISMYRGTMMMLMCYSILAVDFPIFPRRHAKTEDTGYSLMDVGVGAIVFSAGITAGIQSSSGCTPSMRKRIFSVATLVVLGGARVLSVKASSYVEHTSEYGVHWNFFWTLASVSGLWIGVRLIAGNHRKFISSQQVLGFGIFATVLHQFALDYGLAEYVSTAPRKNFISSNKEGLVSLSGYVSLFAFGTAAGHQLSQRDDTNQLITLVVWTCVSGIAVALMPYTASRKLVNSAYICWICFGNALLLLGVKAIDMMLPAPSAAQTSTYITAVSRNQLQVFLVANLITGATNLCLDTLSFPDWLALSWLFIYMTVVVIVAKCLCGLKLFVPSKSESI